MQGELESGRESKKRREAGHNSGWSSVARGERNERGCEGGCARGEERQQHRSECVDAAAEGKEPGLVLQREWGVLWCFSSVAWGGSAGKESGDQENTGGKKGGFFGRRVSKNKRKNIFDYHFDQ